MSWLIFKHPLILLANIVKVGGICLADSVNHLWNPFKPFTRPFVQKRNEPLYNKVNKFEANFSNFLHDGIVYDSTISFGTQFDDVGDEALWHGVAVAMWAMKYSTTKNPADLEQIRNGMIGLDLHQTAHGEPVRRLIRGVQDPSNPQGSFIDDVSNDGVSGHILGIYYAWLHGDVDIKQKAEILVRGIADEVLNNNYCLVGPTGAPTSFGHLINGLKTDPLNMTLCLAILRVAYAIIPDPKYITAYKNVLEVYGSAHFYNYPKASFLTFNNWNDDHRAAIHLSILADFDERFNKGLKRLWKLNKDSGNAWVAYLCGRHISIPREELVPCIIRMTEFYVEDENNTEKINSTNPAVASLGIKLKKYAILPFMKGRSVADQPLPLHWTGSQDFRWQRCAYSVDDWIGINVPTQEFFGLDFLIAYWGFKQLNWL